VIHMCMSNAMVLLCAMVCIVRIYVCIHNYIWLGISFLLFVYDMF
jgi:hypothetical protein